MKAAGLVVAFLLGAYLSIRLLGALYGVLDLWYAVRRTWPRMARGLVAWGGATAAVVWGLAAPYRNSCLAGLAAFALFYVSLFLLRDVGLRALARRAAREIVVAHAAVTPAAASTRSSSRRTPEDSG